MLEERRAGAGYKTYQFVGLMLGPACFVVLALSSPPSGLSSAGWATAALTVWMAIWWATEALPLFVTALLPLVILPLLSISDIHAAATPFANPVVFLLLGGFLIALAVERWNLHRRIAFHIVLRVGNRPLNLIGGVMLASAALSMWITNTATTIMMLPVAVSLVTVALSEGRDQGRDGTNFAAAMLLGVAYAASIGGMGTLIGSPPNALAASYLDQTFEVQVTFATWMVLALPVAVVMLLIAFLTLTRIVFPFSDKLAGTETHVVADMLRELGPVSVPEKRVAAVFAVVAFGWIVYPLFSDWIGLGITDTGIAIAGAIALFAIPADWRGRTFLLDWATARRVPWEILVLFGGGLSLAQAIEDSGLAVWIGNGLSFLHGMHLIVLVLGPTLIVVFLTELMSNTATAAAFLPIAGSLAIGTDVAPLLITVPVALAASSAYMLPVATLPNALVFGTGYVTLPQMLRAGLLLSFIGAVVITVVITIAAPLL
jgi:sodium-dependent dicarboxylate transporter 2/3/5